MPAGGGVLPSRGAWPPGGAGAAAGGRPPWRQSPAEAALLWDARTLASFSISQLDALSRIAAGWCPLLSRTIGCARHGGKRRSARAHVGRGAGFARLTAAYLAEEAELARRQAAEMMRHVWTNYKARAWGTDLLRPVTGDGVNSWGGLGQTLVDALDTLWLMGLREDFDSAADWVESSLNFDKDENVNLFETSIRHLGGLVAAYGLSGRRGLLAKAEDLAERLVLAYSQPEPATEALAEGEKGESDPGVVGNLLKLLGGRSLEGAEQEQLQAALESLPAEPMTQLPYSDVNLRTGQLQNLAQFTSLAEAYVPVEWKALALFTGNCTYASLPDEVLRIVNSTAQLETRGLAPIMLKPDGTALPADSNCLSLGSRGDSFYEYLLKDSIFSGSEADSSVTRKLWAAFREHLPGLYVEADPAAAAEAAAARAAEAAGAAPGAAPAAASMRAAAGAGRRRGAGARNGWFESESDVTTPWLFLKEVGFSKTIPKIDHLVCFLPGAFALDVLHSTGGAGSEPGGANASEMAEDRASELLVAHRLAQTCAHMYFRTESDLAPEITRFNAFGLVDDLGSMHNILRPETVESLFLLWRTTKAQIYRNWGQRILAAFSRVKTPYGYASLHNVNEPWRKKDEMPSFFVAETLKYFFLLFADDSVLPLDHYVLTTEAHPIPTISAWRRAGRDPGGRRWACDAPRRAKAAAPSAPTAPTASDQAPHAARHVENFREALELLDKRLGPTAPGEAVRAAAAQERLASLQQAEEALQAELRETDAALQAELGGAQTEIEGAQAELEAARKEALRSERDEMAQAAAPAAPPAPAAGDQACWIGGFTAEICCWPAPLGNPLCWDAEFTRERCCPGGPAR